MEVTLARMQLQEALFSAVPWCWTCLGSTGSSSRPKPSISYVWRISGVKKQLRTLDAFEYSSLNDLQG